MQRTVSSKRQLTAGVMVLYVLGGAIFITAYFGGWNQSFAQLQAGRPTSTLLVLIIGILLVSFATGFYVIRRLLDQSSLPLQRRVRSRETTHGKEINAPDSVEILTRKFDEILLNQEPGAQRDALAAEIVQQLKDLARSIPYDPSSLIESASPGHRLAAIIMLQVEPDLEYLNWLSTRLTQERATLGLEITFAMLSAARISDKSQKRLVLRAIENALYDKGTAQLDSTDRRRVVLEKARHEIHAD